MPITSSALQAHATIMRQARKFLRANPEEENNSTGEVARRLTVEHVTAVLWLEDKYGMLVDMYNLHNLIEFWPTARILSSAANAGGEAMVATSETFGAGEFNPAHLVEYFIQERGAVNRC